MLIFTPKLLSIGNKALIFEILIDSLSSVPHQILIRCYVPTIETRAEVRVSVQRLHLIIPFSNSIIISINGGPFPTCVQFTRFSSRMSVSQTSVRFVPSRSSSSFKVSNESHVDLFHLNA